MSGAGCAANGRPVSPAPRGAAAALSGGNAAVLLICGRMNRVCNMPRAPLRNSAVVLALSLLGGCESVVPRRDLQLMAQLFPPSPEVSPQEQAAMTQEIRAQTGVTSFEFADSDFTPQKRVPAITQWVLGLFIGQPKEQ